MVSVIKDFFVRLVKSRLFTITVAMVVLSSILIQRLFVLQIVNGENYLNNYTLIIEKTREVEASRGNIYDRNGNVLAYNELAYSVVIEDNGSYESSSQRSEELNSIIAKTILLIESRGDSPDNDFQIEYSPEAGYTYAVSGTARLRFLADIFGHSTVDELGVNTKLGFNEANATAEQIMDYLEHNKYSISEDYDEKLAYEIAVVRFGLSSNYYQKYISTTIATDVSEETVACINEYGSDLQGVTIMESTLRRYVDSEYFCHIIGYTGKISQAEYDELKTDDNDYSLNDYVGKSGIEEYMEAELKGTKGSQTFYVDNLGKVVEITSESESKPGNDVYLSIDKDLQETCYNLLEQEIAGILYASIANIREYHAGSNSTSSDVVVPIYDVYFALIDNNVVDIDAFADEDAMETETKVYERFKSQYGATVKKIKKEFTSNPTKFKNLSDSMTDYVNYMVTMIRDENILMGSEIDKEDDTYKDWAAGNISVKEYLKYCISMNWIDVTKLDDVEDEYSDSSEIYNALVEKMLGMLDGEKEFHKKIYEYMIDNDIISGRDVCLLLFEQDILANDKEYEQLKSGAVTAYAFLKKKIKKLEITPAQLALDPCAGSCVISDPQTGELLACVSYPGYDNNKMANTVDSAYYASLLTNNATPLYDYATQQTTAPGSTFKPFMSAVGLTEGVISPSTTIFDEGVFEKIDNTPKCWLYRTNRGSHGDINVSEALRDSCNYFFYEVGYRLSQKKGAYSDSTGIRKITEYADLFGLSDVTGVEIPENKPQVATEYPVMASIGQSNNSYTTIGLSRYVTAIANSGTVYNYTLLSKVTDSEGNVLKTYSPEVRNEIKEVSSSSWNAIHYGMKLVCEGYSSFDDVETVVAGKTGTAQQIVTRPSHALFIGYAPYNNPTMTIATRIPFGYASANAAEVSANIIKYFFGQENNDNGEATNIGGDTSLD